MKVEDLNLDFPYKGDQIILLSYIVLDVLILLKIFLNDAQKCVCNTRVEQIYSLFGKQFNILPLPLFSFLEIK